MKRIDRFETARRFLNKFCQERIKWKLMQRWRIHMLHSLQRTFSDRILRPRKEEPGVFWRVQSILCREARFPAFQSRSVYRFQNRLRAVRQRRSGYAIKIIQRRSPLEPNRVFPMHIGAVLARDAPHARHDLEHHARIKRASRVNGCRVNCVRHVADRVGSLRLS